MTSSIEHTDDIEDDEPVQPRPRTMRMNTGPGVTSDQAQAFVEGVAEAYDIEPPAAATDAEDDVEDETLPAEPIHSGWTAGQQVMDSTSDYAQALQLDDHLVIIKFLDDQPYANFRRHWVDRVTATGPKRLPFTCLQSVGKDCPLCNIADKPSAVSAFSVAVVGDDGQVLLKTWDIGARLFNVIKAFSTDPKVGPLSKGFFGVNKTGSGKRGGGGTVQTNVTPIKANRLEEDYGIAPPTPEMLDKIGRYDSSIVRIPKKSDLDEIAQEIQEYD